MAALKGDAAEDAIAKKTATALQTAQLEPLLQGRPRPIIMSAQKGTVDAVEDAAAATLMKARMESRAISLRF